MRPSCTPFGVRLAGQSQYLALYNRRGADIHDLEWAADAAEREHGDRWREVSNGQEGISRDEWLESKSRKETT